MIKILIVEDNFVSRLLLQETFKHYGLSHIAVNGREAVQAVRAALEAREPYQLICLDIMMPEMDGLAALQQIRELEAAAGIVGADRARIVMTTALDDEQHVAQAIREQCNGYLVKPYSKAGILSHLRAFGLIP